MSDSNMSGSSGQGGTSGSGGQGGTSGGGQGGASGGTSEGETVKGNMSRPIELPTGDGGGQDDAPPIRGKAFGELEVVGAEDEIYCNLPQNVNSWYDIVPVCRDPKYGIVYYVNYGRDYMIYALKDGESELVVPIAAKRLFCRDGRLIFLAQSYGKYSYNGINEGNIVEYDPVSGDIRVISDEVFESILVYQDMICCEKLEGAKDIGDNTTSLDVSTYSRIYYYFYFFDSGELVKEAFGKNENAENADKNADNSDTMFHLHFQRIGKYFIFDVLEKWTPEEERIPEGWTGGDIQYWRKIAVGTSTWDKKEEKIYEDDILTDASFYVDGDDICWFDYKKNAGIYEYHTYRLDTGEEAVMSLPVPENRSNDTLREIIVQDKVYVSDCSVISLETGELTQCFNSRPEETSQWMIEEMCTDGENVYTLARQGQKAPVIMQGMVIPVDEDEFLTEDRLYFLGILHGIEYEYSFIFVEPGKTER